MLDRNPATLEACVRVMSALVATAMTGIATAQPLTDLQIDYWTVPWENSRPRDPDLDRSGVVWFVGQTGDYVASFDPKNEQFKKIDLDKGSGPHNLIVGEDHSIWYSGNRAADIGRLDPKTRQVKEWLPPTGEKARPYAMAIDDRGRIWFADSGAQPNRLMAFDPKSEQFVVDTELTNARGAVRHMVFHKPGRALWFGTDTNYLVRVKVP
jgi:virginiamycin B lyase